MFKDNEILARLEAIDKKIDAIEKAANAPMAVLEMLMEMAGLGGGKDNGTDGEPMTHTLTFKPESIKAEAEDGNSEKPIGGASKQNREKAKNLTRITADIKAEGEEWRTVLRHGEPTLCEVSSLGRVRRIDTMQIIPIHYNDSGKPRANVYWQSGNGKVNNSTALMENLVARAFIDEALPYRSQSVNHIDGDLYNCRADNLFLVKGDRFRKEK